MPLTMHTVSLTTTEPDGVTPIDGVWTLSILSQKGTLKNLETGTVAAGKRKQETVAGHTQFSLPALPQANIAPADATYRLHFNASGKRAGSFTTEPFTLTANRTLTDLYLESGLPITPSVLSDALAAAERAETAAAEVDAKVAGIPSMETLSTTFVGANTRPTQTRYVIQGQTAAALRVYPTLAAAVAASSAGDHIVLNSGDHAVNTSIALTDLDHLVISGQGVRATRITVSADVTALNFTSCSYPTLRDLTVYCSTVGRTVFPVRFTDCTRPQVVDVYFDATAGARHSGLHLGGVGGVASMGVVRSCVFNHCCILVEVDDVKISNSWIWGQTNDYCVAVRDGSASVVLTDCDVVPPYASTATGIAAVVVGDDGSRPFNFKINGLYLDGNPTLNVRAGVHIFDGAGGVILSNIHANQMDAESIILDSCFNVLLDAYTSYANNRQGNGSPEIRVRATGVQPTENIRIRGAHFLQTEAIVGTAGPAIKVESTVSGSQVSVESFDVKQPDAGGGYSLPEIDVPKSGDYPTVSMWGRGKRSVYSAVGSQAVASGAAGVTINLATPYGMAYRPRPSQIRLATEGASLPAHRIQFNSDNQIYVAFAAAIGGAATIHWRADLRL